MNDKWYKKGARLLIGTSAIYIWMGVQKLVTLAGVTDPYMTLFGRQLLLLTLSGLTLFYAVDLISSRIGLLEMKQQDEEKDKDDTDDQEENEKGKEANLGVKEEVAFDEEAETLLR